MRTSSLAALYLAGLSGCRPEELEPGGTGQGNGLWGSPREGGAELLLPATARPEGVLELFLFGGLNPWDTFYVVPEHGDPALGGPYAGTQWWTFQEGEASIAAEFERCGGGNRPLLESAWATDALGAEVRLGPFLYPLRDRPDILSRMRMWVMRHDQPAHETAVPLTLCGLPHTSPRMASTAAHVQRFFGERQDSSRGAPWATVIYPGLADLGDHSGEAAEAVGLHGGLARPPTLRLGEEGLTERGLDRAGVAERKEQLDRLVDHYGEEFADRLVMPGSTSRVRAPAMTGFEGARAALKNSEAFLAMLGDDAFSGASGQECEDSSQTDFTAMSLRLAVSTLTHPTSAPRWVTALDGGLLPALGGTAYDTHVRHVHESARNIVHTMRELTARINEPGEGHPDKLDLDRHTVVLTTEFGRTPYPIGDGLNHWSEGYIVVAFGGLFTEDHSGVVGSIAEDGFAEDFITPTDFRAALLLAMNIWPFNEESFAVADVSSPSLNEIEATVFLREHVLGYRL